MGNPIEIEPPDDPTRRCVSCESLGWPENSTPTHIRVVFRGVKPCDPAVKIPNGFPINLNPAPWDPCAWQGWIDYEGFTWVITTHIALCQVDLKRVDQGYPPYFQSWDLPCESGPHLNRCVCSHSRGYDGHAYVLDLPNATVQLLAKDYNLQPDARGLYHFTPCADPAECLVRLVGQNSPGSVEIRYRP